MFIFFTTLKNIWLEIDQGRPNKMTNTADIKILNEEKDLLRDNILLNGLDAKNDSAKRE